jgi:hypothetical protein
LRRPNRNETAPTKPDDDKALRDYEKYIKEVKNVESERALQNAKVIRRRHLYR